jgi:hypothetical protein
MTTFTLRLPSEFAGRVNSDQMRSWLADFLRCPGGLPVDPGAGRSRISLSLPAEIVLQVTRVLRCSPSEALRRLAAHRLGVSAATIAVAPTQTVAPEKQPLSLVEQFYGSPGGANDSSSLISRNATGANYVFAMVASCLPVLAVLAWLFFAHPRQAIARRI